VALALGGPVGRLGHLALLGMHLSIVTSMPLDIGTFNLFYAVSSTYLLRWRSLGIDLTHACQMHPLLLVALASKLMYVVYGFARPLSVHYLQGWRIWAGNWTLAYVIIRRSAVERFAGTVKSRLWPPFHGSTVDFGAVFGLAYPYMLNLCAKGLAAHLTRALEGLNAEDYCLVHIRELQLWMMGETWGDVNIMRAMRASLVQEWKLQEGDMRMLVISGFPWMASGVEWHLQDLRSGNIASGFSRRELLEQACTWPSSAMSIPNILGETPARS